MISAGHYAVIDRFGRVVARYESNRLARMRAAFVIDARILWITGRLA